MRHAFRLIWGLAIAAGSCGCQTQPSASNDETIVFAYDLIQYVNLVPCDFDAACVEPMNAPRDVPVWNGLQFARWQVVQRAVPVEELPPSLTDPIHDSTADIVQLSLTKPYLARIRALERELQRERVERSQLERQLQALRDIDREVARGAGGPQEQPKQP